MWNHKSSLGPLSFQHLHGGAAHGLWWLRVSALPNAMFLATYPLHELNLENTLGGGTEDCSLIFVVSAMGEERDMSKRAAETGRKYVLILISYILKDTKDCKISQMKITTFFIENDDAQEDNQVVPTGSVDESSCFSSESSQIYL